MGTSYHRTERQGNTERHQMRCADCSTLWEVMVTITPGFADHANVVCKECGADMGEIRADFGYTMEARESQLPRNTST